METKMPKIGLNAVQKVKSFYDLKLKKAKMAMPKPKMGMPKPKMGMPKKRK